MWQVSKGKLTQCEAKELPLENASKDILSIAYGIRNVVERKRALEEFARVIKPNGILVILEFTKCENPTLLEKLMGFYTKNILLLWLFVKDSVARTQ